MSSSTNAVCLGVDYRNGELSVCLCVCVCVCVCVCLTVQQQVDVSHSESGVSVDSLWNVSDLCLHVNMNTHTHTHTHTHTQTAECICCCLGGMEQQGDLRRGEQLCFASDVPFGCGGSRWRQHSGQTPVFRLCFTYSSDWRCWVMTLPLRLKAILWWYPWHISWEGEIIIADIIFFLGARELCCSAKTIKNTWKNHKVLLGDMSFY